MAVAGGQLWRLWPIVAIAIMAGSLLALPLPAAAWQATPAATTSARPRCLARPIAPSELVTILQTAAPDDPDGDDPHGDAVPPGERAPLGDLVGRWSNCLASGDVSALLGLFTPDGVRRLLGEQSPFLGGPAGLRVSILSVGDVVRLGDGRMGGRVTVDPSGTGAAAPVTLVMVIEQGGDGVWRIDHLRVPAESVGAPSSGGINPGTPRPLLRRPIAPGSGTPVAAPGPAVPMRGGDLARTGNQPGPAPAAEPVERWRTPTGWHSDAQPIVARGLAFFGGFTLGGRTAILAGVDAASGGIRWQTTAPVAGAELSDAPALSGDTLFAPVQAPVAGVLAVVDGTGEPLWYAPFGFTSLTAPAVDTDRLYVAGWGLRNARDREHDDVVGAVMTLDQRSGRERWRFLAPVRFGALAVGRDAVFVPSDHGLFALDRSTGRKRWQARFSPGAGVTPMVTGTTVIVAGSEVTSGKTGLFALDAASGALLWRVDMPKAAGAPAATAVAGDTIYLTWWEPANERAAGGATLRAYDLASGKERWVYSVGGSNGVGSLTGPVVTGDLALFGVAASGPDGNQDGLYAVDSATGILRWRLAAPIGSTPAVLGGDIFVMGGADLRGDAAGGRLLAYGAA